jgi:hypothetical protein
MTTTFVSQLSNLNKRHITLSNVHVLKKLLLDNYFTNINQSTTQGLLAINIHNKTHENIIVKKLENIIIQPQSSIRYTGIYGYGIPFGDNVIIDNKIVVIDEPVTDLYVAIE